MTDIILILFIVILASLTFALQTRYEIRKRREARNRERLEALKETTGDRRTIDLIGEEAYHDMTRRIEEILERHSHQNCINLTLTCGPDTVDGAHELHSLLPGYPIKLVNCSEGGVETVDVYYNGCRVGRFALLDAMTIRRLMSRNHIRGAYVAEQNCYGIINSHQLAIIIFYEPIEKVDTLATAKSLIFRHRDTKNNTKASDFCQN